MPIIANFLAPFALLVSGASMNVAPDAAIAPAKAIEGQWSAAPIPKSIPPIQPGTEPGRFASFVVDGLVDDAWNQVRIEQRMIIRIAPRLPGQLVALPPRQTPEQRFSERKTSKCLPVTSIAGVHAESSGRLMLVMRNRRLIGATLDKTCHARDFYSGFYVEQNADGQLCAGRDIIHSRAGANCAVTKLRELVPDDD